MKNIQIYTSPDEVRDYTRSLWKTNAFRDSHDDEQGYVRKLVNRFAQAPRAFGEMDDPEIEWSHFTAWMNLIALRDGHYEDRPMISDLYYLHEIYHIATMKYDPNDSFEQWAIKMLNNERGASIESEVVAYFALPEIREDSFKFRIWADRFLMNHILLHPDFGDNHELYRTKRMEFMSKLHMVRHRAMIAPIDGDKTESWIKQYADNNHKWFYTWQGSRELVEAKMAEFVDVAKSDRERASAILESWLDEQNTGLCPFEEEARKFAKVVKTGH